MMVGDIYCALSTSHYIFSIPCHATSTSKYNNSTKHFVSCDIHYVLQQIQYTVYKHNSLVFVLEYNASVIQSAVIKTDFTISTINSDKLCCILNKKVKYTLLNMEHISIFTKILRHQARDCFKTSSLIPVPIVL